MHADVGRSFSLAPEKLTWVYAPYKDASTGQQQPGGKGEAHLISGHYIEFKSWEKDKDKNNAFRIGANLDKFVLAGTMSAEMNNLVNFVNAVVPTTS